MKIFFYLLIFIVIFTPKDAIATDKSPFGHDILLIITYNFPYYGSVSFLRNLYKPWFPNVVFYGPNPHPEVNVCYIDRGCYAYAALADAMQKYPNYKGYFQVHDDCIINCWNLVNLNKNKIWVWDTIRAVLLTPNGELNWNWLEPMKYYASLKFYENLKYIYKNTLKNNSDDKMVYVGYADIVYIPSEFKDNAIELFIQAYDCKLFLEIAIPTVVGCLDAENNWEHLHGVPHQNGWDYQQYNKRHQFVHPIKLSKDTNRLFINSQFASMKP